MFLPQPDKAADNVQPPAPTAADYEFAANLLRERAPPEEVVRQLCERGMDGPTAQAVLHHIAVQWAYHEAADLVGRGTPAEQVEQRLRERGWGAGVISEVMAHLAAGQPSSSVNPLLLFCWVLWIGGTILIVASWVRAVTPTVGWVGFGVAFVGYLLSTTAQVPARQAR